MVVDLKRFTPGGELQEGLLTVVEQMPGLVEHADKTRVRARTHAWLRGCTPAHGAAGAPGRMPAMRTHAAALLCCRACCRGQALERGYWPSYNVPYFDDVYNRSGAGQLAARLQQQDGYGSVVSGACVQGLMLRALVLRLLVTQALFNSVTVSLSPLSPSLLPQACHTSWRRAPRLRGATRAAC